MASITNALPSTEGNEVLEAEQAQGRGWYECMVDRTGPAEDGTVFIWLRHRGGKFNCWFSATLGVKREMLAIALAAISGGRAVDALVSGTKEYSVIERLYIKAM
jgi:hypothetical protein